MELNRWLPGASVARNHMTFLDCASVTLSAHKVTDFMSLTSGAMWGPHNEGFHLTLTLWVDKVTEAQSGREYVREVRQPHIDPRSRLSFFIGSSTSSQYRRGSSSTLIICHPPHSTSGLDLATRVCFCSIPLTLFLSLSFCSFSFCRASESRPCTTTRYGRRCLHTCSVLTHGLSDTDGSASGSTCSCAVFRAAVHLQVTSSSSAPLIDLVPPVTSPIIHLNT
jgi:hypothetical protein